MESILLGNGIRIYGRDYDIVGVQMGDAHSSELDIDVFDVFDTVPYTYLEISRGGITGNVITTSYEAEGIFDLDTGLTRNQNSENVEQGALLDIKPTESFLEGVPANREHYTLTLVQTDWSDFDAS